MTTFDQKLQEWFVSETHLLSDGRLKLFPETTVFCRLIEGKHKKIWKYVVDHVRSRRNADKVRLLLPSHLKLENPYSFPDANQVLKRISKAKEKRSFLESSLSELKREITSSENEVQGISDEICTTNQKSAILELITTECKQKCADLNSVKSQLSFYIERHSKTNTQFYLALSFPLTTKSICANKVNFGDDPELDRVKNILRQISSLIIDSKSCDISESLINSLKMRVGEMINTISMADLFIILKEISNTSYMKLMSKETYSSTKVQAAKVGIQNSVKYLQDMKLDFIQSSFNVEKTKKEIDALQDVRKSLLKKFILKSDDAEFEKKFQLFEKTAENAGLSESIKFLEHALKVERNEAEMLKKGIGEKTSKSDNVKLIVRNFYASFDKLCLLLKSGSSVHECILKSLSNLHKFANEQMFSNITCTLKEYPFQMTDDLKFDIQTMWSVLEKKIFINPLVPSLLSVSSSVPDILTKMLDLSKFHNECVITHKVKKLKEESAANQDSEFKFDDNVLPQAHQQYISMTEILQMMQNKLELCSGFFLESSEQSKRTQVVMHDWWKQGAQFVPQIEYEGKSLKMWLDILLVLPDL